ncbi:hypothetical protein ACIRPK_00455 [Kitasatospora sp. NPDC101801]|uniref:hypothetical protein n=1 Tax=Kitasatospora sp. NPDC101801 TaxID=3364103 RepID=UPI0038100F6E
MDPDIRRALTRALGIAAAALALCVLGLWGAATTGANFGHSAGLLGTPGHLVAASCELDPAEPSTVSYCRGTFHPEGDAPWVAEARVGSRVGLGREVPVRCTGRSCHLVEPSVAVAWAAAAFAALAAAAVGVRLLLGLARPLTRTRRPERIAVGAAVALGVCAVLNLVAALATAIVDG